jgi:uncharacterized membrane protein
MEQIQYYFLRGIWESRAGVIWGPFSEIYGLGAVLMFLLYQKLKNTSPLMIFSAATICGSAFEYYANFFQEVFLGSVTWNYSRQPFNIGGRTSLKYGMYWGLLGLVFIKWIFPLISRELERIKGKFPFILTWVFIIFISLDLLISALSVNRWNERMQGVTSSGHMEEFLDNNYGNDKMKQIFPHLKFLDNSNQISTAKSVKAGLN